MKFCPSPEIFPRRRGFTLIELLAVVAIVAVLAALLFPIANSMIQKAHTTRCQNNLRQIGIGMQGFIADNDGRYPTMRGYTEPGTGWAGPFWTDQTEPYTGSESAEYLKHQGLTGKSIYYCPSSPLHHGISDYGVNQSVIISPTGAGSTGLPAVRIQNPARTVLAVDAGGIWAPAGKLIGNWILSSAWVLNPPGAPHTVNGPVPRHGDQLNVLFCDGRVEAMTYAQLLDLHPTAFEID